MNPLLAPSGPMPTLVDPRRTPYPGLTAMAWVIVGSIFLALTAQITIGLPAGLVPITGSTFGVLLIGAAYGSRLGSITMLVYVAEGVMGLPVFANGGFGLAVLNGPTGGYILGYIGAAAIVGWLAERGWDRSVYTTALAMVLGNLVIYSTGVLRLQEFTGWEGVWAAGIQPFLPGDLIKILLAAGILPGAWWLRRYLGGPTAGLPREDAEEK